jgi:hypothetical protein
MKQIVEISAMLLLGDGVIAAAFGGSDPRATGGPWRPSPSVRASPGFWPRSRSASGYGSPCASTNGTKRSWVTRTKDTPTARAAGVCSPKHSP